MYFITFKNSGRRINGSLYFRALDVGFTQATHAEKFVRDLNDFYGAPTVELETRLAVCLFSDDPEEHKVLYNKWHARWGRKIDYNRMVEDMDSEWCDLIDKLKMATKLKAVFAIPTLSGEKE